ncbi:VOC family protein [Pilimelia terevasa]|nr:VOC family protein [Pilimelia terevasa]
MSGQVVHFEIPADDVARARSFYADVFGWQLDTMPDMNYTVARTTPTDSAGMPIRPGAINGGIFTRSDPVHHPVITIDVADVDAALGKVERTGGKTVMPKQAVGEMGYVGYFADPEGNIVGLWQTAT